MFDSFLSGVFLGFGVSVPFGPVNILMLAYALKAFKNSLAVGIGAFLNGLNPFVIGFWLSVSSVILSNKHSYVMTLGLMLAILFWVVALALAVARYSHVFSARVIFGINLISAFIIEYFALSLIYKTFIG